MSFRVDLRYEHRKLWKDVIVHELATLCLASISVDYTSKVEIFEHGGLEPLIRLLSSSDPDVLKNSVESISNLVKVDFQNRAAICELNGVPPILELLKSEYPVIQQLALQTLTPIVIDPDCRIQLRQNKGLESILQVLETPDFTDLHVEALTVLANCLEDVETMQVIRETGGLEKFLTFVTTSTLPEAQKRAAKAITASARNCENRKFFHEQGVEKALVNLLGVNNDGIKIAACQAVSVMCELSSSKEAFKKELGIPQLVRLLVSDNEDVKEAAALALANLTTANPTNATAVFEADGVEPLVKLLTESGDGAVANAATVLTNMALQESSRSSIQYYGAMTAIVEPLKSTNTVVQSKAAQVVAALACDADARTQLRTSGGLEPLVKLLHSNHDEVRRNACWAVLVCGKDEPTAIELCKLGALEILQEINLSTSRQNSFSEAAVNKLLDSNPTLKYALTGYLSSNNIITDGFYDLGQVKANIKILNLDELSKQELNQQRPILLINAKKVEFLQHTLPTDEKQLEISPLRAASSKSSAKTGKGRSRGRREEEKMKEEEQAEMKPDVEDKDKPWEPPYDPMFDAYVSEVAKSILPMHNSREQVISLAMFVAEKMGGSIDKDNLYDFPWELHIGELKFELKSNVIPIGNIQKGIFYHRALLFKALGDRIGISSSLVRGAYNRAWNHVLLIDDPPQDVHGPLTPPKEYVVDLMHKVGNLMKSDSAEAVHYQLFCGCKQFCGKNQVDQKQVSMSVSF
ncbi:armadillo repeat-containing protein 3 [Callorhinchus milii]|nr:armadillo repeat-containing protein 3 [Callorhinchus milii]